MDRDPLVTDALAGIVDAVGRRWNGYELHGVQNIPRDRPSLLVAYHGFVPLDGWFLLARLYREHGLLVRSLTDRFMFRVPGLRTVCREGGAIVGEPQAALELLRAGETVIVSPGGVRAAIAGRPGYYRVTWGQRLGFARLALEANVPLIPLFGENVEELYRSPGVTSGPVQALYERTRLPLVPIVGLGPLPFPVKIRTWIGEPVEPRGDDTPESLRDRTRDALQHLIDAHQGARPRLLRGLAQRVSP